MGRKSRLKVGIDVPWVTSWTDEEVLGARPCASVGGLLAVWQAERPGFGRPNYSRNHMMRQRWSVRRMLCPMCGQPTEAGDRWVQTGRRIPAGALRARGFGADVPADVADARLLLDAGSISPAHRACADLAMQRCPHLQAHGLKTPLPFPARWFELPLMVPVPPPPNALRQGPATPAPAVMFLQLCGVTDEVDPAWR